MAHAAVSSQLCLRREQSICSPHSAQPGAAYSCGPLMQHSVQPTSDSQSGDSSNIIGEPSMQAGRMSSGLRIQTPCQDGKHGSDPQQHGSRTYHRCRRLPWRSSASEVRSLCSGSRTSQLRMLRSLQDSQHQGPKVYTEAYKQIPQLSDSCRPNSTAIAQFQQLVTPG